MATTYTEHPTNYSDIESFVKSDVKCIKSCFYAADRVVFYDACSFQRHSNMGDREKNILIEWFKRHRAFICITRCILMELASDHNELAEEYIKYIKELDREGVEIAIFDEECIYDILSDCFSANERINEYLIWAVRMVKSPVSTIEETLKADAQLAAEVIEGKNLKHSDLYHRFFATVRGNKEHADNLGEELIAICIHILSHLPGVLDGKLCVITDDKGAAGKIDSVMRRTNPSNRGARIILFSTPKMVQNIFQEHIEISEGEMINLISQGTNGTVAVMGITAYDLEVDKKISLPIKDLAQKIMEPNGINILF